MTVYYPGYSPVESAAFSVVGRGALIPSNPVLWLNSQLQNSTITKAYQDITPTGSGTSGTNTITASATMALLAQVGNKIRIGGTDIYTISAISTVTITTTEILTSTYTAGSALALDKMSTINDVSGNANNATQATPADQPSFVPSIINSKNAMGYNGTVTRLAIATSATMDNIFGSGGTQMFILNPRTAGGSGNARLWDKTNNLMIISGLSGGKFNAVFQQNAASNWQWSTTATAIPQNATSILVITYDASTPGTAPNIYINSNSATALTNTSSGSGAALSDASINYGLGNRAALDRGYDGLIAECAAWKKILNATEIAQAMSYAHNKYNITIS